MSLPRCQAALTCSGLGVRTKRSPPPPTSRQRPHQPPLFWLVPCTGHHVISRISCPRSSPRLQFHRYSTHRHPSRISTTATTPSHAATAPHGAIFIYQRVSSKVLASAGSRVRLRNLRRLEELSTAPKTWKCRLLDPRPAGCGERTGVLGRGCHIPLHEGSELPASDTALLLAAWFCWACGDVVPFHQSSVVVASLSIPPYAVAS